MSDLTTQIGNWMGPSGDDQDQTPPPAQQQGAIPDDTDMGSGQSQLPGPAPGESPLYDAGATPHQMLQSGAKKIIGYLMGAGAAPPTALQTAGQTVDPHGQMSESDRNLVAIHKAVDEGDLQTGWALVQANRQQYNAKQAFAKAALNGIQGKPADPAAAAQAATQAAANLPDGNNVVFQPSQGGFTATVTIPGTRTPQQIQLSAGQFDQWLDIGKEGQFDKVLEHGGAAPVLTAIAKQQPAADGEKEAPDKANYGEELEERSRRVFPWISQESQRQQWMGQQEQSEAERQNKVDVAKTRADALEQVAGTRAGAAKAIQESKGQTAQQLAEGKNRTLTEIEASRHGDRQDKTQAAREMAAGRNRTQTEIEASRHGDRSAKLQQQADQFLQRQQAQAKSNDERNRIAKARMEISDPNALIRSQGDIDKIMGKYGVGAGAAPQAPTPQAPAPAARKQGPDGRWYVKGPDGKAVLDPNQ